MTWGAIIIAITAFLGRLLEFFDKRRAKAEAQTVARQGNDAARTDDAVARLPDAALDAELRFGPK